MAIKVFCHEASFTNYEGDPLQFGIQVPYSVYCSDGGADNAPRYFEDVVSLGMEIGSTPTDVYSGVYSAIQAACTGAGYPQPSKADMYAYVPTPFVTLLPSIPDFA
jgi:hypothetical protein